MKANGLNLEETEKQLAREAERQGVELEDLAARANFSGDAFPEPSEPLTDAEIEWIAEREPLTFTWTRSRYKARKAAQEFSRNVESG